MSHSALAFFYCATAFIVKPWTLADWQRWPPNSVGFLSGYYVYQDDTLQGKTIELRDHDKVLSTITLEG